MAWNYTAVHNINMRSCHLIAGGGSYESCNAFLRHSKTTCSIEFRPRIPTNAIAMMLSRDKLHARSNVNILIFAK